MAQHSNIVGGSTAKRVMGCPGSVALCAKMPPRPSSVYADLGTLLHTAISQVLDQGVTPESLIGMKYQDQVLTQDHIDNKLHVALNLLGEIDPKLEMEYAVETEVGFDDARLQHTHYSDHRLKLLIVLWPFLRKRLATENRNYTNS